MKPFVFERPITTDRLTLRPIVPADFDDIHAYMGRHDVATWLLEDAYTLAKSRELHPIYCRRVRFETDDNLILIAIEHEGRVIGHLDCTSKSMADGVIEIGWRLHPDSQRRGFGAESVTALLDLAFGELGARRAVAYLDARNDASAQLCERVGMRREAHHMQDMWFKGDWSDTLIYAILAPEWHARRTAD